MRNSFSIGLMAAIIVGCNSGHSLSFEHDFGKEMTWKEAVQWDWNIQKNDRPYTIHLDLQCAVHYPYDKLPIQWTETDPMGNSISHELDIVIRNEDGTYNGDKALDYLNFDIDLATHHQYPQFGVYHYSIEQKIGPQIEAPYIVEFEISATENQ
jgi:hypothetical protein